MHLEHLEVVNFRGIGRLNLDLDEGTTVLFGENAWGKTSLVEALQSALGTRPLTEADFHRLANAQHSIAQRLGITLRFIGEPSQGLEPFGWRDVDGAFRLALHCGARRLGRGRLRVRWGFLDPDGGERELPEGETATAVARVKREHPLHVFRELRLADWILAPALRPDQELHEAPEQAVSRVFERLLTVPHQVHPGELARGLQALERLTEQRPELFQAVMPAGPGFRRASDMAEAPMSLQDGHSLADLARRAGAGTRQVVLLALVGSMLKSGADGAQPGASPLLLLEDPETHLHPIQLALLWNLVEQLPVQKLVSTAHGGLLGGVPMRSLRRLVRRSAHVEVFPDPDAEALGSDDARRVAFHVRTHQAESLFARAWLLVEGETEAWLLPELARVAGLAFPLEGISCVPFAQSGLSPLVRFADRFGIPWHLVSDGDEAGRHYQSKARRMLQGRREARHLTVLPDVDMEHFLWRAGFAETYRAAAGPGPEDRDAVIHRALRARSKPGMALAVAEEAGRRGASSLPLPLRRLFAALRGLAQRG